MYAKYHRVLKWRQGLFRLCLFNNGTIYNLFDEHGIVPENICTQISPENSIDKLKSWLKLVTCTDSIESFESRM